MSTIKVNEQQIEHLRLLLDKSLEYGLVCQQLGEIQKRRNLLKAELDESESNTVEAFANHFPPASDSHAPQNIVFNGYLFTFLVNGDIRISPVSVLTM